MRPFLLCLLFLVPACATDGRPGDWVPDYAFVYGSRGDTDTDGSISGRDGAWNLATNTRGHENTVGVALGWSLNRDQIGGELRQLRLALHQLGQDLVRARERQIVFTTAAPAPIVFKVWEAADAPEDPPASGPTGDTAPAAAPDSEDEGPLDALGVENFDLEQTLTYVLLALGAFIVAVIKRTLLASWAVAGWSRVQGGKGSGGGPPSK